MPSCTICTHPQRVSIDMALVAGASQRTIAKQYGVSSAAVKRHKDAHLSPMLQLKQEEIGDTLYAQIVTLNAETLTVLAKAQADGKGYLVLRAVEQARANLEVVAELLGKVNRGTQVNVLLWQAPEWIRMREFLLQLLTPEQLQVFTTELVAIEAGDESRD